MAAMRRLFRRIKEGAPIAVVDAHHLVRDYPLGLFLPHCKVRQYFDRNAAVSGQLFNPCLFLRQQEHAYLAKLF
jgi:hypothetical protein